MVKKWKGRSKVPHVYSSYKAAREVRAALTKIYSRKQQRYPITKEGVTEAAAAVTMIIPQEGPFLCRLVRVKRSGATLSNDEIYLSIADGCLD